MKKFEHLLKASKSEKIDALIDGLPVNGNGYFLTEEQATSIDAELAAASTASESISKITEERDALQTKVTELEASATKVTELEASVNTLTQERNQATEKVTKLEAEVTRLGALDAGKKQQPAADEDRHIDANDAVGFSKTHEELKAKAK